MPSVAEWDSVYNKTLELISVRVAFLFFFYFVRGALDLRGAVKDVVLGDVPSVLVLASAGDAQHYSEQH